MADVLYISDKRVRELLDWKTTFEVTRIAMESVATKGAFQYGRQKTHVGETDNLLYTMPGYLHDAKYGALACKLVTYFPGNDAPESDLPTIMANILYMDEKTGELKAVIAGTEITSWRTSAASAVATKYLKRNLHENKGAILAILGASTQGRYHALAFKHLFDFKEIRIWNRTKARAQALVDEFNQKFAGDEGRFVVSETTEDCVRGADVIVTATSPDAPVVRREWIKKGVHINSVGVGAGRELDEETYRAATVYVDHWKGAATELGDLRDLGIVFEAQVGDVIAGSHPAPDAGVELTIFQSLGMAVEDCAMARLIYDLHHEKTKSLGQDETR